MTDAQTLVLVAAIFLVAGTVKGVVGFGLPAVSLVMLTFFLDLPSAMAVLLIPVFFSNLVQAANGDAFAYLLRRLWPFLLPAVATVFLGVEVLSRVDQRWLVMFLGCLMIFYAAISLAGLRLSLSARQERWAAPVIGAVNGVIAGMTGVYVALAGLFLQAIGLAKDQLVQALGIYFTLSTVTIAIGLGQKSFLTPELGWLSAFAVAPAVAGLLIGRRVRRLLPEEAFRRVFLTMLALIGLYLALSRLLGPL
jgi:uncharacterized membrane protein YfcA